MAADRRRFLGWMSSLGLGGTLMPGLIWARLQDEAELTDASLRECEKLAGLSFTEEERAMMLRGARDYRAGYARVREVPLTNAVPPAIVFDPEPGRLGPSQGKLPPLEVTGTETKRPSDADLAFADITRLARLLRGKAVTSVELTKLALARLEAHDDDLQCVVTLTAERALAAAAKADRELAAGRDRGPLHGIPWGAKDIIAARGHPTTWGAKPFENQVIDEDATVVRKLGEAGAVLVAKLTTGALAMGDRWFGGTTKNPWNTKRGSSGSSAGPASAVSAGLVPFAIGSETLGSIVSPCRRCGVTGLRPTFGRVSRHGVMALSWTMDKMGPIARSVEDCALVFDAIHGADGLDPTAVDRPFGRDTTALKDLRIGYVKGAFDGERAQTDKAVLDGLTALGAKLTGIELPRFPYRDLLVTLKAEAAAAFDDITRDGRVRELVAQARWSWPNTFRTARTIPAVEYIQANRVRTLAMRAMSEAMKDLDLYVAPSHGGATLTLTNLTGHPAVVMPNGFRDETTPVAITFIGRLHGEARLLNAARQWQETTDFHTRRPPGFA